MTTTSGPTVRGRLPQSLRILGKRWEVRLAKLQGDMGKCDFERGVIHIHPTQGEDHMRDTALHEPVHAISEELQLKLSERQVRLLATGLLALLRDNPGYVRFLTD